MILESACFNTDNGVDNEKEFSFQFKEGEIIRFWSKTAAPTDNSRVERPHLADEKEVYGWGNIYKTFEE